MVRNYRLNRFDQSGKLVGGKAFGICTECLPLIERKVPNSEVLTPADDDKTRNPCHRCKATHAQT